MSIHNVCLKLCALWPWLLPLPSPIQPCTEFLCDCNSKIELSTIVYSSSIKTTKKTLSHHFPLQKHSLKMNEIRSFSASVSVMRLAYSFCTSCRSNIRSAPSRIAVRHTAPRTTSSIMTRTLDSIITATTLFSGNDSRRWVPLAPELGTKKLTFLVTVAEPRYLSTVSTPHFSSTYSIKGPNF